MTRKDTRQDKIIELILEEARIPTQSELAEKFGVSERTIRRDMKEIEEKDKIPKEAWKETLHKLMLRLNKRVESMPDYPLLKLLEFFKGKPSQKIEADVKQAIKIVTWDPDADKDADQG